MIYKESLTMVRNPYIFENQAKIHLNLPNQAWEIIRRDIVDFGEKKTPDKPSNFINQILISYLENNRYPINLNVVFNSANEEASLLVNEQTIELPQELRSSLDRSKRDLLKRAMQKNLSAMLTKYKLFEIQKVYNPSKISEKIISSKPNIRKIEKGEAKKIDLNKECQKLLKDIGETSYEDSPLRRLFDSVPSLVKGVLLDYTSLQAYERCQIYRYPIVDKIDKALKGNTSISVYIKDNKEKIIPIIPYGLCPDSHGVHSYLVGLREDTRSMKDIKCWNLSTITRVDLENRQQTLTKDEKRDIESKILEYGGVQYIRGGIGEFAVKLTEKGERDLYKILEQRPLHLEQSKEDKENRIYRYRCSEIQIINYFRRFGSNAVIISPKNTREKMLDELKKAVEEYEKTK